MYVRLVLQKAELEQRLKSKNPLKAFANRRAARTFLVASQSLYYATKVIKLAIDDTPCDVTFSHRTDLIQYGEARYHSKEKMCNKWTVCLPWCSACAVSNMNILRLTGDVPPDANITGVVVSLDQSLLDDTTMQQMLDAANAFEGDQAISGEHLERRRAIMTYTFSSRCERHSQRPIRFDLRVTDISRQ